MARPGSKRQVAIDLMNANTDRPMAEVIAMIAQANNLSLGAGRSYYVYLAENGFAQGTVDRTKKPKAEKAPKAEKIAEPKAEKPKKPKAEAKSADEVEAIKAANLKRLKEVHSRYKQNVKKLDAGVVFEADPFGSPAALSAEEVRALV
jgi:hypothetical protein